MRNSIVQADKLHINVPFEELRLVNLPYMPFLFENSRAVTLRDRKPDPFNEQQEQQQKQGVLQRVDLSNVVFDTASDLDGLSKLKFIDCNFNPDHKLGEDPNKTNRLKRLWKSFQIKYNYIFYPNTGVRPKLEADYRYLRKFYDAKGEYISGNDFHYNYMEQKRYNSSDPIDGLFLLFYKWVNGYSTKPARSIVWLLLMPAIFLLLFSYQYNIDVKGPDNLYKNIVDLNLGDQIGYLMGYVYINILPLNILTANDLFKVNDIKTFFLTSAEHLISLIIIPLMALAFYNRYRRNKSDNAEKSKES